MLKLKTCNFFYMNDQCLQMLHYYLGATAYSRAYFGAGTGNIVLSNVHCRGTELKLGLCERTTKNNSCSHNEDAGVRCASKFLLIGRAK